MVGFVIVSHSETLANGVVELTKMMADGVPIRAAGGLDGGGFGTSYAVFTGIGIVGTAIEGVLLLDEGMSALKLISLVLLCGGIIGLKKEEK